MKLHSLHVQHFKALTDTRIDFNDTLTIIHAHNESGKSSLLEALNLILFTKASSKSAAVKASQTKPFDHPIVIEVDCTIASQRLTYRKQYLRSVSTTLVFPDQSRPGLSGDDAHEYVAALLAENIDQQLWDAFMVMQNSQASPVSLKNGLPSLASALDAAQGASTRASSPAETDVDDGAVVELIEEKYDEYYAKSGKERGELKALAEQVSGLDTTLRELRAEYLEVEDTLRTIADAQQRITTAAAHEHDCAEAITAAELNIDIYEHLVTSRQDKTRAADKLSENISTLQQRIRVQKETSQQITSLSDSIRSAEDSIEADKAEAKEIVQAVQRVREELSTTQRIARVHAHRCDLFTAGQRWKQSQEKLAGLQELATQIDAIVEKISAQQQALNAISMTEETVKRLEELDKNCSVAEGKLQGSAPSIAVTALNEATMVVRSQHLASAHSHPGEDYTLLNSDDTGSTQMDASEQWMRTVNENLSIQLGEDWEVNISVADEIDAVSHQLRTIRAEIQEICDSYGISGLEQARELMHSRSQITADMTALTAQRDALESTAGSGGITSAVQTTSSAVDAHAAQWDQALSNVRATIESMSAHQREKILDIVGEEIPDSTSEEEITLKLAAATAAHQAANATVEQCREHQAALETDKQRLEDRMRPIEDQVLKQRTQRAELEKILEGLAGDGEESTQELQGLLSQHTEISVELSQISEKIDAFVVPPRQQLEQLLSERANIQAQQASAQTDIKYGHHVVSGFERKGITSQLQRSEADFEQASIRLERMREQAEAIKLLHETVTKNRSDHIKGYQQPYFQALVQLGRRVFGSTFSVELGDNLDIISRKVGDVAVSVDQLSGGAKEQLALVSRLACARLISHQDSVPLFLDDALGHTDSSRRRDIATMLHTISDTQQVIVLTCDQSRFNSIPDVGSMSVKLA